MPLNADFRDLFAALNEAGAKYLMVGGYALAYHAQPRFTRDMDIWVEPEPGNAVRVMRALEAFGAPTADVTAEDLSRPDVVFQIGVPPNRIDILTGVDGVAFVEAWGDRAETPYGDQSVSVIGRKHLIQNKRASGRPRDLADLALLGERP